jgi:SAM-dependent methyltransferase
MEMFDEIADSWDSFRRKPFPPIVETLAKEWHGRILDVGCGNARNLLPFDGERFGIDSSKAMINAARGNAAKSHKDAYFDHVLCVAALHHLPLDKQLIALQEMKRILKPTGKLLLTVWNKWQRRFVFKDKEQIIPWKVKGESVDRYYYFHNIFSLKKLVKQAGFKVERSEGTFGKNVILVARRDASLLPVTKQ